MVRFLVIITLFLFSTLHAEQDLRQAAIYYEAKEYQQAQEIYEALIQSKLDSWQKNVVNYNLGTVLLAEGKFEQAISALQQVQDENPLLLQRAKTNQAIAQYRLSKQITDDKLRIYSLRDALKNLEIAENARCALQKLEGFSNQLCKPSENQTRIHTAIKKELSLLEQHYDPSIADLIYSVQVAQVHLDFLEQKQLSPDLKAQYQQLFYNQANAWAPSWNALIPNSEYVKAIELMKSGSLLQSREILQKLEVDLKDRLQKIWASVSQKEAITRLISIYENILAQVPLQPIRVKGLLNEIKHIQDKGIVKKLDVIAKATAALDAYELQEAYIYLKVGLQELKRSVRDEAKTPKVILQNAIDDQINALSVNRHRLEIAHPKPDLIEIIVQEQKQVLITAKPFYQAAIEAQKAQFKSEGPLSVPWDELIPTFDKGYEAASAASEWIAKYPEQARDKQNEALKWWQQALTQINQPEKKEAPPKPEKPQPEEKLSMQKVKELLQEMEFDDEIPKTEHEFIKKVPKPW